MVRNGEKKWEVGSRKLEGRKKMKGLIGQYSAKVSGKGRTAFPKRFREVLGEKIIVTRGYEGSLIVVSEKDWLTLTEGTGDKPFIFGAARDTTRFLLGNAALVELDGQGRFVIPNHLKEYGQFKEEALFLGLNRYVEIWAKEKWESYQTYLSKNIDKISEKLNEKV